MTAYEIIDDIIEQISFDKIDELKYRIDGITVSFSKDDVYPGKYKIVKKIFIVAGNQGSSGYILNKDGMNIYVDKINDYLFISQKTTQIYQLRNQKNHDIITITDIQEMQKEEWLYLIQRIYPTFLEAIDINEKIYYHYSDKINKFEEQGNLPKDLIFNFPIKSPEQFSMISGTNYFTTASNKGKYSKNKENSEENKWTKWLILLFAWIIVLFLFYFFFRR